MNAIVVGVDHSPGARAALLFANEEARLRGATLHAVHAWIWGYVGYTGLELGDVPVLGGEVHDVQAAAEAALVAIVRQVLPETDVPIEMRAVMGTPAAVLVDESKNADLLVVGSRGHGGFAQLLLGSVSQQCAHHAACPVVIVHAPKDDSFGN